MKTIIAFILLLYIEMGLSNDTITHTINNNNLLYKLVKRRVNDPYSQCIQTYCHDKKETTERILCIIRHCNN
jgi:hypothetical protein